MDPIGDTGQTFKKQGKDLADLAASAGKDAFRAAERTADKAFEKMSKSAQDLSDKAAPAIKDGASDAQSALDSGLDYLRNSWPEIRDWLEEAADRSIAYAKKEPFKATLTAAVAIALLLGVFKRSGRSRQSSRGPLFLNSRGRASRS